MLNIGSIRTVRTLCLFMLIAPRNSLITLGTPLITSTTGGPEDGSIVPVLILSGWPTYSRFSIIEPDHVRLTGEYVIIPSKPGTGSNNRR